MYYFALLRTTQNWNIPMHTGKWAKEFSTMKVQPILCVHCIQIASHSRKPFDLPANQPTTLNMREICLRECCSAYQCCAIQWIVPCHTISMLCICSILIMSTVSFEFFIRTACTLLYIFFLQLFCSSVIWLNSLI